MKKYLGILSLFVACFGFVAIVHAIPIIQELLGGYSTPGVTGEMPTNFVTEIKPTIVYDGPVNVRTCTKK